MNYIYAYLRASTKEQDAKRAHESLMQFAANNGRRIAAYFTENASGATLHRPELMRLLENTRPGDSILVESIDRLSRMHPDDWEQLKRMISDRGLNIVALDLPTTHTLLQSNDVFTDTIIKAINQLIVDILAAVAHKDYLQRRERQQQGIAKAKANGKYRGRKKDADKHAAIEKMLLLGLSIADISKSVNVSRSTVNRVKKSLRLDDDGQTSIFQHISKK